MNKKLLSEILAEYDRLAHGGKSLEAGNFLRQHLKITRRDGDFSATLSLLNELIGYCRMNNDRTGGLAAVEEALDLIRQTGMDKCVSRGTILVNAATALHSFGENDRALELYNQAYADYSGLLPENDPLFAGCFNNMAAVYASLKEFETAEAYYMQALEIQKVSGNAMDTAVTWVNLAQLGCDTEKCLDQAWECFNDPSVERNGYYAHTCAKCAGAFETLGRKETAGELRRRAEEFYERY